VNVLFLSAPPETFQPAKDTTRVLMESADRHDWHVYTATHEDLEATRDEVRVVCRRLRFPGVETWFTTQAPERLALSAFTAVCFRHDPPFDSRYLQATRLVELASPQIVVNDPAALRAANEKLYALRFAEWMPETLVTRDAEALRSFAERVGGVAVVKPLDGFGGAAIFRFDLSDPNAGVIAQTATADGTTWTMAQAYLPGVNKGDTRILLWDGGVLGAFRRVPKQGEFRGNMAQGGRVERVDLSDRMHAIVAALGPQLVEVGLRLVGLDIIDDCLTEVNVTSPTGFQEVEKLYGIVPADPVWATLTREASR